MLLGEVVEFEERAVGMAVPGWCRCEGRVEGAGEIPG